MPIGGATFDENGEQLVRPLTPELRLVAPTENQNRRWGQRLPVRLKACLIGEVEVLFRYTRSGL